MKRDIINANTPLFVLLCLSSLVNVGLGRKVQVLQRAMRASIAKASAPDIVGARLISLSVKDIEGRSKYLAIDTAAAPLFIYVFRPTCGWCAKNLANIKALDGSLRSSNKGQVIGLSLDDQGLKTYIQSAQLPFPVYTDLASADIARLGLGGTPQTIVVSHGTVVHNWRGAYSGALLKEIDSTLGMTLPGLQ